MADNSRSGPVRGGRSEAKTGQAGSRKVSSHPGHAAAIEAAEVACLGAAILSGEARDGLRRMLTPSDFGRDAHRVVFDVVCQLVGPVDLVVVTVALADRHLLDEVGGAGALSRVTSPECCPSPASWPVYGTVVAREGNRRRLRTVLRGALARLDNGADPAVLADEVAREVAA
jgi:replicative DNA helicase